jgi:hypothetical protein
LLAALADPDLCGPALLAYDAHPPFVEAFARLLGIDVQLGANFRCVLPGHAGEGNATLWRDTARGIHVYRDLHGGPPGWPSYALSEAFAFHVSGRPGLLRTDEDTGATWVNRRQGFHLLLWRIRLQIETGFLTVPPIDLALLGHEATDALRAVHEGVAQLYAIRRVVRPLEDAAPLARAFLADWCGGMAPSTAEAARNELADRGIIRKAFQRRPEGGGRLTWHWLPNRFTLL